MKLLSSTKFQILCVAFLAALLGSIITTLLFTPNTTLAAAKLQGYQIVTASVVSEDIQEATTTAFCPAGKKVLGGSGEVTLQGVPMPTTITDKPLLNGSGWTATSIFSTVPHTLTVYAICVSE